MHIGVAITRACARGSSGVVVVSNGEMTR
jgi:hypothetical protein